MLLGSPPDMVRGSQLRRDPPVNERRVRHGPNGAALKVGMTPAKRVAGTRHRYRPGLYGLISHLVYYVVYHISDEISIEKL